MYRESRKISLRQGNAFTPVCHSIHRGGLHSEGVLHPGDLNPEGSASRGVCIQVEGGGGWSDPSIGYYGVRSRSGWYVPY